MENLAETIRHVPFFSGLSREDLAGIVAKLEEERFAAEQVTDSSSIEKAVEEVLAAHSQQVSQYRSGNEKVFGFLVGQVMKATQGKASPQMVNEILRKKLT